MFFLLITLYAYLVHFLLGHFKMSKFLLYVGLEIEYNNGIYSESLSNKSGVDS